MVFKQGKWILALAAGSLFALAALPRGACAQAVLVLKQGDISPDGSPYASLRRPDSGGAGRAAFVGRTELNRGGLYVASGSPGTAVTETGDVLAGSGVTVRRLFRPSANALGETVWQARVAGAFGAGIFSSLAGYDVVAAHGDPVGLTTIRDIGRPVISDNGVVMFHARLSNLDEGLFLCSGGDLNCHSGTGTRQQIAGLNDVYFDSVHAENRVICDLSEQIDASNWGVAFRAETARQVVGCAGSHDETILRMQYGGSIETVITGGDPALPFDGSRYYSRFDGPPAIDNDGDIAVLAETVGPVQEVIYLCRLATCPVLPAEPMVLQRADDGSGRSISRFKAVGMSDANDIGFQAVATGLDSKTLSIYVARYPGGTLERIAANKDPSPGGEYRGIGRPAMSSDGYVVFEAQEKTGSGAVFALWSYQ